MRKDEFNPFCKCELCKMSVAPVVKYRGKWYHTYCKEIQQDYDKSKNDMRLKKGYDKFHDLMQKI